MMKYYQMSLTQLLSTRQIVTAQYNLCLSYHLHNNIMFYLYQAEYYSNERDCIDVVLDEAYNLNVDNLLVSNDLLSQFSCN